MEKPTARPPFFYPPSLEFMLRRSLHEGPVTSAPEICIECGRPVGEHLVKGAFIGCVELWRRREAAGEA